MIQDRIKRHEGKRNKPYKDTVGKLTIGYGRNLDDVGLSDAECDYLFANDFKRALLVARSFHVYDALDEVRRGILIEMCFQMGRAGVANFKKFLAAAERKDWDAASGEMLDSKWAKQTPGRAKELADIFRTGVDPAA
jgi:lysozyme